MKMEEVATLLKTEIPSPNEAEDREIKNFINSLIIKQRQLKKDYSYDEVLKMWRRWRAERLPPV